MSTTAKIKNELIRLLSEEENKAGLTTNQVWEKLEQADFKEELYNPKGERRAGTLVGLTTRIKSGKVEGLKVIKNSSNKLVYVLSSNQVDFLVGLTEKYLKEATNFKLKTENFNDKQRKVIENYSSILPKLQEANIKLQKLADEVEKEKLEQVSKVKESIKNNNEKTTTNKKESKIKNK